MKQTSSDLSMRTRPSDLSELWLGTSIPLAKIKTIGSNILVVTQNLKKTKTNDNRVFIHLAIFMLNLYNSEDINKIYGIHFINDMVNSATAQKFFQHTSTCVKCT